MALVDTVRQALRIKSEAFDGEITTLLEACKIDLAMAGVARVSEDDPSFTAACIQYCKANFGQDTEVNTRERWGRCYQTLRDSMAVSKEYGILQNPGAKQEVASVQPGEMGETEEKADDV